MNLVFVNDLEKHAKLTTQIGSSCLRKTSPRDKRSFFSSNRSGSYIQLCHCQPDLSISPHFAAWGCHHSDSGESNRPLTPILLKSIAIHLPFLSRYFCTNMPSSWQKVVYTPPICITIRLPFVSQYFCRSIRARGRWNTPKLWMLLPQTHHAALRPTWERPSTSFDPTLIRTEHNTHWTHASNDT